MGPLIDAQASKERGCAEDDGDGNRDVEKLSGLGCISMEELTEFDDIQDGRNKVNRSQRRTSFAVSTTGQGCCHYSGLGKTGHKQPGLEEPIVPSSTC